MLKESSAATLGGGPPHLHAVSSAAFLPEPPCWALLSGELLCFHCLDYLDGAAAFGESWSKNRRSCWLQLSDVYSRRSTCDSAQNIPHSLVMRGRITRVSISTCLRLSEEEEEEEDWRS